MPPWDSSVHSSLMTFRSRANRAAESCGPAACRESVVDCARGRPMVGKRFPSNVWARWRGGSSGVGVEVVAAIDAREFDSMLVVFLLMEVDPRRSVRLGLGLQSSRPRLILDEGGESGAS